MQDRLPLRRRRTTALRGGSKSIVYDLGRIEFKLPSSLPSSPSSSSFSIHPTPSPLEPRHNVLAPQHIVGVVLCNEGRHCLAASAIDVAQDRRSSGACVRSSVSPEHDDHAGQHEQAGVQHEL